MDAAIVTDKKHNHALLVGVLIALFYYQALERVIFSRLQLTLVTDYCHDLLICTEVIALYFYAIKVEGNNFLIWTERPRKIWFYIIAIVTLFLLQIVPSYLAKIPERLKWPEIWQIHHSHQFLAVILEWYQQNIFICILSTILWSGATELIFRGYLLPRLSVLFKSNIAAIIVSAFLFALFPFISNSLHWLIYDFITGILLAAFYVNFRNIKVVIIVRVLIDVAFLLLTRPIYLRLGPGILKLH